MFPLFKYSRRKTSLLIFSLLLVTSGTYLLLSSGFSTNNNTLQSGDIIFQSSELGQSKAVQLATHSIYSHCGIIFIENNEALVYEAVGPVISTPLKEWIRHGTNNQYVVRRLKNASIVLQPAVLTKMKSECKKYLGKSYDLYFGWSDDKIYCSELVWKIYKQGANIEVGKLQKLKEFDLTSLAVKEKLKERYGAKIPLEEIVVSPQGIFDSELLITVEEQ
jgi:hypothetical protein